MMSTEPILTFVLTDRQIQMAKVAVAVPTYIDTDEVKELCAISLLQHDKDVRAVIVTPPDPDNLFPDRGWWRDEHDDDDDEEW